MSSSSFTTLKVSKADNVGRVTLNRPEKRNAMNTAFWRECRRAFDELGEDPDVRVIIVSGEGKAFSSGLDMTDIGLDLSLAPNVDVARKAFRFKKHVAVMQEAFNAIERVPQPVIAAVHGACIGAGVDLISACDIRLASAEAVFSIKEVQIGLAADLGTLQRLPKIVGNDSIVRELAYTGRNFTAQEGAAFGLFSRVLPSPGELADAALALAKEIASKSPVAVVGTKANLRFSREHNTADGLEYMTTWNMAALQTEDLAKAVEANMTKTPPSFSKL